MLLSSIPLDLLRNYIEKWFVNVLTPWEKSYFTILMQFEHIKCYFLFFFFIFIIAPCILKIDLAHTNKCTNYIIYYLKSILIIDIRTLSYFHSSYMFQHITCHPQGALMFLAKITGKQVVKHVLQITGKQFVKHVLQIVYQWF
jgi:hypothetical protein